MLVRKSLNTNADHEVHNAGEPNPRVQDPIDLWRFRFVDPSRGREMEIEREREREIEIEHMSLFNKQTPV